MALFESGTLSGGRTELLSKLRDFVEANGWTVDLYTANSRLHFHKGAYHFECSVYGGETHWAACTGYDSGATAWTQPGTSAHFKFTTVQNQYAYAFVSCETAVYMSIICSTNEMYWGWTGAGWIPEENKIGAWAGGQFIMSGIPGYFFDTDGYTYSSMYIEDAWTGNSAAANGIVGTYPCIAGGKQPFPFNYGVLPLPVTIFQCKSSSYRVPIGYAPGAYRLSAGNIYTDVDILQINGADHVLVHGDNVSSTSSAPMLAFKLGA